MAGLSSCRSVASHTKVQPTCQPGGVLKAETLKKVSRKIGDEEILGSQHPAFGQCFKQFLDGSCKVSSEFLAVHICIVADLALIAAQTGLAATYPATLKLQRHAMCHFHARLQ